MQGGRGHVATLVDFPPDSHQGLPFINQTWQYKYICKMTTKNQQIIIEIIELDKIIDLICIFIIHISQNEQFVSIGYFQSGQWMWLMELVSIVCVCPAALVCTKHTTLHNAHIHAAQNVYS